MTRSMWNILQEIALEVGTPTVVITPENWAWMLSRVDRIKRIAIDPDEVVYLSAFSKNTSQHDRALCGSDHKSFRYVYCDHSMLISVGLNNGQAEVDVVGWHGDSKVGPALVCDKTCETGMCEPLVALPERLQVDALLRIGPIDPWLTLHNFNGHTHPAWVQLGEDGHWIVVRNRQTNTEVAKLLGVIDDD